MKPLDLGQTQNSKWFLERTSGPELRRPVRASLAQPRKAQWEAQAQHRLEGAGESFQRILSGSPGGLVLPIIRGCVH